MTDPNRNALWGRCLVEELAAAGLEAVCLAPGSRSTPLAVAFAAHPEIELRSHLDERSAAYFALGRGRRTGEPTAVVCTSGTAAANVHPAVIEADRGRVPLLVLTADRPHELRDSGANQTIDQVKLYGDAVRWYAELPEPVVEDRAVRSLRTTAARAFAATTRPPAGPVHLNCPFRKPLEPTPVPGDVPDKFAEGLAARGRDGPFVESHASSTPPGPEAVARLADAVEAAERPLLVAGPADPGEPAPAAAATTLADAVGAPILADPLSGLRFGPHVSDAVVCGGYDAYVDRLPEPDLVVRVGASPTSKRLRESLRDADARQLLVDPAGGWREATFTATGLLAADPGATLAAVADSVDRTRARTDWLDRFRTAEDRHWTVLEEATTPGALAAEPFEGAILAAALAAAPDPATVFVSNSMPVRDADRFGRPRSAALTVLGNRGASGIDGITSTALGAGDATDDPLVLVTGDLALYHDANGLLALDRLGVDATIVLIDNDGGGIFHMLPIEGFDPPFTGSFKTPHGLAFEALEGLYDLEFRRVDPASFAEAYRDSVASPGSQLLAVEFDAASSHRRREALGRAVRRELSAGDGQP